MERLVLCQKHTIYTQLKAFLVTEKFSSVELAQVVKTADEMWLLRIVFGKLLLEHQF